MSSLNSDSDLYLRVREREGRLYSDEVVARLPAVPSAHPLWAEWKTRAASAARLTEYLARLPKPLTILDLGCGNGWLSNQVALVVGCRVTGVDFNHHELSQAARVFPENRRLAFVQADIFQAPFGERRFEVALIASAAQYFSDLPALIRQLFALLVERGEIHLLDSPFYAPAEVANARQRSQTYYTALGLPQMAAHYQHHGWETLSEFKPVMLYDPHSALNLWRRRLRLPVSPFPWIRLRK